jgi:hypothetical protein
MTTLVTFAVTVPVDRADWDSAVVEALALLPTVVLTDPTAVEVESVTAV